jgi:repressor LexA
VSAPYDEPTDRQRDILTYLVACLADGLMPTIREIGERFGISSTNGVNDHLLALERKGLIERDAKKARAMYVTARGRRAVRHLAGRDA